MQSEVERVANMAKGVRFPAAPLQRSRIWLVALPCLGLLCTADFCFALLRIVIATDKLTLDGRSGNLHALGRSAWTPAKAFVVE